MTKQNESYKTIRVESFKAGSTSGLHGSIHIRPLANQGFSTSLHVECSKKLTRDYPVGTIFEIQVKLTDRQGGGEYLYSSYKWPFTVIR